MQKIVPSQTSDFLLMRGGAYDATFYAGLWTFGIHVDDSFTRSSLGFILLNRGGTYGYGSSSGLLAANEAVAASYIGADLGLGFT